MHGGLSTGPKSEDGKARCAEAARRNLELARKALHRQRHPPTPVELEREQFEAEFAAAEEREARRAAEIEELGFTWDEE